MKDIFLEIDLKEKKAYIDQYVSLRNTYVDLLLTDAVSTEGTRKYLETSDNQIRCVVRGDELIGAAILYLDRNGEITFFSKYKYIGIGSLLLSGIEKAAKEQQLSTVWAWVLKNNSSAQRSFEKNGYSVRAITQKTYKGNSFQGVEYEKKIG